MNLEDLTCSIDSNNLVIIFGIVLQQRGTYFVTISKFCLVDLEVLPT